MSKELINALMEAFKGDEEITNFIQGFEIPTIELAIKPNDDDSYQETIRLEGNTNSLCRGITNLVGAALAKIDTLDFEDIDNVCEMIADKAKKIRNNKED